MNTYWESGGIAPRILKRGTRWKWSDSRHGHFNTRERAPGTKWAPELIWTRRRVEKNLITATAWNWTSGIQPAA